MHLLSSPDFSKLTELAREVGGEAWPILVESAARTGALYSVLIPVFFTLALVLIVTGCVGGYLDEVKASHDAPWWPAPLVVAVPMLIFSFAELTSRWLYMTYPEGAALLYVLP